MTFLVPSLRRPTACLLVLLLFSISLNARAQEPDQLATEKQIQKMLGEATDLKNAGNYDRALSLVDQALKIAENKFGKDDPFVYLTLSLQGKIYTEQADYARAEPVLRRALEILRKAPETPESWLADSLQDLAIVYDDQGQFSQAAPLYEQCTALKEKLYGPGDLRTTGALNYLGNVYLEMGDYAQAEKILLRVISALEKSRGPEDLRLAAPLNNLASVYDAQHDATRAETLYLRALAIAEKARGPENVDVANYANNLGTLYRITGNYDKAAELLLRALAIREKVLGPEHPDVAQSLNNLAMLYVVKGDLKQAEGCLLRGLAIVEKALGPSHPNVGTILGNLAFLYQQQGEIGKAVSFLTRANAVREHNTGLFLSTGSEEQKRLYMATLANDTSATVSLHLRGAADNQSAAHLALTAILQRKGRVLDSMSDQLTMIRERSGLQDKALLYQLSETRARLTRLVINIPESTALNEYLASVRALESEVQKLEKAASENTPQLQLETEPVTVEAIQKVIPNNAALVEIIQYRPATVRLGQPVAWGPPEYAAYVLKHEGQLSWVNLGKAAEIDSSVEKMRFALRNPLGSNVKPLARQADELVMRPIRRLLGNTRTVLLSPDGMLNLIPFAALVDDQNRYLVENYTITYLTSGRELLKLQKHGPSKSGPVVIANPKFGDPAKSAKDSAAGRSGLQVISREFHQRFGPLDGTAEEAQGLKNLLPNATILTGDQATEKALKQMKAPSILHVATHGFFLPREQEQKVTSGNRAVSVTLFDAVTEVTENPLLRSGIALAGANQLDATNGEDGILTALEASGLDLWGTRLVVLSACETGVGDVQNGEGVYGLRRALVLAGAESELMSLWKVNDDATRDLMIDFYRLLQSGSERADALRQVQLKMLKTGDQNHPYFWAAFILSGDWRKVDLSPS